MDRWEMFTRELQQAEVALQEGRVEEGWRLLERAHILGQPRLGPHLRVHWCMLRLALRTLAPREVVGQLLRLSLVVPGTVLGRLPAGNTGRAKVSAFQPMEPEEDLQPFLR